MLADLLFPGVARKQCSGFKVDFSTMDRLEPVQGDQFSSAGSQAVIRISRQHADHMSLISCTHTRNCPSELRS